MSDERITPIKRLTGRRQNQFCRFCQYVTRRFPKKNSARDTDSAIDQAIAAAVSGPAPASCKHAAPARDRNARIAHG